LTPLLDAASRRRVSTPRLEATSRRFDALPRHRALTPRRRASQPRLDDSIMSYYRDLLRVSEANRIVADHMQFQLDLEEIEAEFGPTTLPRRILKDRQSPLESMRPVEFRMTFGMSKDGFRDEIHQIIKNLPLCFPECIFTLFH
jgi:hypothetical protein